MASKFPNVSRYPGGFRKGVEILGMPVLNTYPGNVRWVNSTGGSDGNDGSRGRPYATLAKAIGDTASNNGDVIMLMPKHVETISDAVVIDTTGVTIQGLGNKGAKPTFTFSGGAVTDGFHINVADVTIDNIEMVCGIKNLVNGVAIDATGATLSNITFVEGSASAGIEFLHCITSGTTVDNVCDDLTVQNCEYSTATSGNTGFISIVGNLHNLVFIGNKYLVSGPGTATGLMIAGTAGDDLKNAFISGNYMHSLITATDGYPFLNGNLETTNSGFIVDNMWAADTVITEVAAVNQMVGAKGFAYGNNVQTAGEFGGTLHPSATGP